MSYELPDIQHSQPPVSIKIGQVGVQNIVTRFLLESKYNGNHELLANVSMSTNLDETKKGISMSMLIRSLLNYIDKPLKHGLIERILRDQRKAVETDSNDSFIKFDFMLPMRKEAPLSKLEFPQYYKCSFEGRLTDETFRFFQRVNVQYSSYCPCSASLCNHLIESRNENGYPHAQRSFADVLVEVNLPEVLWLEDIIELVEKVVVNIPIPILRRMDEQEFARIAAKNPMFVEDAIRLISQALNNENKIYDWIVKCTHEESIHTHEAIAINWRGVKGGFNGLKFL